MSCVCVQASAEEVIERMNAVRNAASEVLVAAGCQPWPGMAVGEASVYAINLRAWAVYGICKKSGQPGKTETLFVVASKADDGAIRASMPLFESVSTVKSSSDGSVTGKARFAGKKDIEEYFLTPAGPQRLEPATAREHHVPTSLDVPANVKLPSHAEAKPTPTKASPPVKNESSGFPWSLLALGGIGMLLFNRVKKAGKGANGQKIGQIAEHVSGVVPKAFAEHSCEYETAHVRSADNGDALSTAPKRRKSDWKPEQWDQEVLLAMDWKVFEDVCVDLLRSMSGTSTVEGTGLGPDGGVDLRIRAPDGRLSGIGQCKCWATKAVGPKIIREFVGAMSIENVSVGFLFAAGRIDAKAAETAKEKGIRCFDGAGIVKLLNGRKDCSQILKRATSGEWTTPSCPNCGIKLVPRKPKNGGAEFWGCHNFPKCKYILNKRVS